MKDRIEVLQSVSSIPTTDPQQALNFCQNLSRILKARSNLPESDEKYGILKAITESVSQAAANLPDLSVVAPVYNEQDNIGPLHHRLLKVLEGTHLSCEIIFVNDGSQDKSPQLLEELAAQDHRITVVELARNFGHQVAITAGLEYARGKAVVVMDADLQDPPEVMPQFIAKWKEGYDVVYGVRRQRDEGWLKRLTAAAFYRLFQRVANIKIPLDSGDFCLMDRRAVDMLIQMPERNRFIRGIRSWIGLRQVGVEYDRPARHAGQPKYTFSPMLFLALDGLFSFSYAPLRIASLSGLVISLLSILTAVFYAVMRLTTGLNPPGFATLIVAILFLAGIQLITIGVIGEYIGRIFDEVKQRPLYVVRRVSRRST